ncbi:KRAB-A domain protein, partial [Gregarina niphandrodes]
MQQILGNLLWKCCLAHIDDILVFGGTFEEHNRNLREVLRRMREHDLLLKVTKCRFAYTHTEFLGYVVTDKGVQPDKKKVDKLRRFPVPTTVKELRSFLGL